MSRSPGSQILFLYLLVTCFSCSENVHWALHMTSTSSSRVNIFVKNWHFNHSKGSVSPVVPGRPSTRLGEKVLNEAHDDCLHVRSGSQGTILAPPDHVSLSCQGTTISSKHTLSGLWSGGPQMRLELPLPPSPVWCWRNLHLSVSPQVFNNLSTSGVQHSHWPPHHLVLRQVFTDVWALTP